MSIKHVFLLLFLLTTICLVGACGDEDTPLVVPPATPPGYASADLMIAAFKQAYEDMDASILQNVIHEDYQMFLQQSTIQEFPRVGPILDRAEELRIAERMFSGTPLIDPDGALVQAISSVSVALFEQQTAWTEIGPGLDFAGEQMALFDVTFIFDRPGSSSLKIIGVLKIMAAARDTTIGGTEHTYWQMIGQQDLSNGTKIGVENTAWGELKAMFWIGE